MLEKPDLARSTDEHTSGEAQSKTSIVLTAFDEGCMPGLFFFLKI